MDCCGLEIGWWTVEDGDKIVDCRVWGEDGGLLRKGSRWWTVEYGDKMVDCRVWGVDDGL